MIPKGRTRLFLWTANTAANRMPPNHRSERTTAHLESSHVTWVVHRELRSVCDIVMSASSSTLGVGE